MFLFKSQTQVSISRSGLSNWLNNQELIGLRVVTKSDGVVFQTGGKSWHRGTVTFKTSSGERTVTHLQSLSLPARHYYFDRPLPVDRAVNLAAGQIKPEDTPGFAGKISNAEGLCMPWVGAKRGLILARLHWG